MISTSPADFGINRTCVKMHSVQVQYHANDAIHCLILLHNISPVPTFWKVYSSYLPAANAALCNAFGRTRIRLSVMLSLLKALT